MHEPLALGLPFSRAVVGKVYKLTGVAQIGWELFHESLREAPEHTVGGENRQAGIVDVGEIHHREVKPLIAGDVWHSVSHHLLVVQTRLIPMMAIGDERPAVGHHPPNLMERRGLSDRPHAVQHLVLIAKAEARRPLTLRGQDVLELASVVGVQREDLVEIGLDRRAQVEEHALGMRRGLLMREDDPPFVGFEPAQCNNPLALPLGAIRQDILLGAEIHRHIGVPA
jgi:hypothetical protein